MCTQEIRFSPPEASLCTCQHPRDYPDGPHREENTAKEECEVLGLGAGVKKVCGATGERRKEKAIAQPSSSPTPSFKIRLLLLPGEEDLPISHELLAVQAKDRDALLS